MSYLTEKLLSDIKNEFPDMSFEYIEMNFGGIIPAFFINIEKEQTLTNNWKAITEFIAVNYQASLMDEFSVWNIYLFFQLSEEIQDDLKYHIENDTFSSRKIIITPIQDTKTIIREHVLNSDLIIKTAIVSEVIPFNPNPIINDVLNGISAKKKLTPDIESGLSQIIERIKLQQP